MSGLREALEKALASLPVVTHDNGYRVQALPKSELLDVLAAHPAEPRDEAKVKAEALEEAAREMDVSPSSSASSSAVWLALRASAIRKAAS